MTKMVTFGCPIFKNGSGIHIKEKNKGKFTASANFARNAAKWKHEDGAKIHKPSGHRSILDNGWIPTTRLKKGNYGLIKTRKQ